MADKADRQFMQRALELAARGRGRTSPNPMVGAVIVRKGKIVGEGYHHAAGKPHAEVEAIRKAKGKTKGATIYVTLEPCCHSGRTGPCTEAIIKAGITRVVFAAKDPDPRVCGGGGKCLREAGLEVSSGLMRQEARLLNDMYFGYKEKGRPYIVAKTAQTIDGRVATVTGDSQWISCHESLVLAHQLRADVDAVLVGGGTARDDNPSLTVRHVRGKNPYRIVLSSSMDLPRKCNLLENNADFKTILATSKKTRQAIERRRRFKNVIFWDIATTRGGKLDVLDLMHKAEQFGLQSILVEGGPTLITSLFRAHLVDKYVLVTAPKLLGKGRDAVQDLGKMKLGEAVQFEHSRFEKSGVDSLFIGYPVWEK